MLSPLHSKCFWDSGPFESHFSNKLEQSNILLNVPRGMAEFRVQIIDPLFSALLQRSVVFSLGSGKQLERVKFPLEIINLIWVWIVEIFIFLDYLGKNLNLGLHPLDVVFYPAFEKWGKLVFEEMVGSL